MFHGFRFRDCANDRATAHFVTDLKFGRKLPVLFTVKRIHVDTTPNEGSAAGLDHRQGALHTIENTAQQARSQFNRKWQAGVIHGRSGMHPGGLFIHLNSNDIFIQADDLTYQLVFTDLN